MAVGPPRVQQRLIAALHRHRVTVLRVALGLVFLWFGGLKLVGKSPVEDLVALTIPWLPAGSTVLLLGVWEVILGVLFLLGRWMRWTLVLFLLQMAGTFLVLIVEPRLAFQSENPLLLTTLGEFVVKNLVLVAAGLSIAGHMLPQTEDPGDAPRRGGDTG